MSTLALSLLGGFEATVGGARVEIRARKLRALLAYLATSGAPCSRERLSDLLWGDISADEQARRSLRQALTVLRRALPDGLVVSDRDTVQLDMSRITVDVRAFEELAKPGCGREADAVRLYAGDFLAGFSSRADAFDEWVTAERSRLRTLALDAMERLCAQLREAGQVKEALSVAMRIVALDPLRESAHRELMMLLSEEGRRAEALRQYEECRRILAREVGADPSPTTHALAQSIAFAQPAQSKAAPPGDVELRHACVLHFSLSVDSVEPRSAVGTLQRFGGHVVRRDEDQIVAVFGASPGQSNEMERALQAALHLREAARRSGGDISIGLAFGQLMVDRSSGALGISGDPLRSAAELHQRRTGIIVSQPVYHALAARLKAHSLSPRGTSPAWCVDSLAPKLGSAPRPPLFGRKFELAQLEAMLRLCGEHSRGRTVVIQGEAGIGKTRLALEIRQAARERGWDTHMQAFVELGQPTHVAPLSPLVQSVLGCPHDASYDQLADAVDRAIAAGELEQRDRPMVNALLGAIGEHGPSAKPGLDERRHTLAARLVEARARRVPMLIWLEDVHWADGAAREQIAALMATISRCSAVLLMTTRMGSVPWRGNVTTLELGPLDLDESTSLVRWLGSHDEAAIVTRGGGNPLFLCELARTPRSSDDVPDSVKSLVQARMDALPQAAKAAARAASVLGHHVDAEAFDALQGSGTAGLGSLEAHGVLERSDRGYVFVHAVMQEAIYASILPQQLRELHLAAARYFSGHDSLLHARHLDRAADPGAPNAYLHAAKTLLRVGEPRRALELCERGLELWEGRTPPFGLLQLRGELLGTLGRVADSLEVLQQASELASDPDLRCRLQLSMAASLRFGDRQLEALDLLARAEQLARTADASALLAELDYQRGSILFPLGDIEGSLRAHESSLVHACKAGDPIARARATSGIADAEYAAGRFASARARFEQAQRLAGDHALLELDLSSQGMLAFLDIFDLRIGAAVKRSLQLAERSAAIDARYRESFMRTGACYGLVLLGQDEQLYAEAVRATSLAEQIGAQRFEALSRSYLAIALARIGRHDEGAVELERARALADTSGLAFSAGATWSAALELEADTEIRRAAMDEAMPSVFSCATLAHGWVFFAEIALESAIELRDVARIEALAANVASRMPTEPSPLIALVLEAAEAAVETLGREPPPSWSSTIERVASAGLKSLASKMRSAP